MCSLEGLPIKAHAETELAVSYFCRLYPKSFITYQMSAALTGENNGLLRKEKKQKKNTYQPGGGKREALMNGM